MMKKPYSNTMFAILSLCGLLAPPAGSAATGEVPPRDSIPCFPGAYYRKAVSSVDHWTGIEGVITLPAPALDDARFKPAGRHLDNPSIYLGGRAGDQEIDAGLTWEVIREPDGSVSRAAKAFRPFWRNAGWHNAPARPDYYYYPGDTVRMRCAVTAPGKLEIRVDLLARAESEDSTTTTSRESGKPAIQEGGRDWAAVEPLSTFSVEFDAPGFGPEALQEFKRVNAIDQSGNEGKGVQPTQARVDGAVWHEVWLLRGDERLPMILSRFTDMRCPDPKHFVVAPAGADGRGGERISIFGNPQ